MDRNADSLDEPLLLNQQESSYDENEFHDAFSSIRSNSAKSATAAIPSISQPMSEVPATPSAPEGDNMPATSYYGKVSPLSTGMMFPSSRGIVDTLPIGKPCFMFADHDPLCAIAHICLLEKEAETMPAGQLPTHTTLFNVVHVCRPLANHEDAGMRILKKIQKKGVLELPVLLHSENILEESEGGMSSLSSCLLPEYIDEAIGTRNLLRPSDPVGLYNMKLVSSAFCHLTFSFSLRRSVFTQDVMPTLLVHSFSAGLSFMLLFSSYKDIHNYQPSSTNF